MNPSSTNAQISLAHGEGGRLMRQLIAEHIVPELQIDADYVECDAAILPGLQKNLAMTTDCFVVSPLFFPGGDIGSLSVYGTVNDLAVAGALPRWMSLGLIIEEGLPLATLQTVLKSIARAAATCRVEVVTGDTKVVPQGIVDQLFINTTGVGEVVDQLPGAGKMDPGDVILVTGPIGMHGIAVLSARENLALEPAPESDSAPLLDAVAALRQAGVPVRAMRDATRGGVSAVLHEWTAAASLTIELDESRIPVTAEVRGASELLGLDPLHIACEGTMLVAVPEEAGSAAVTALRSVAVSQEAAAIGRVEPQGLAPVVVRRALGQQIPLDEPAGAPLPRIC